MTYKDLISSAQVLFDNDPIPRRLDSPSQPLCGITTGQNDRGQFNGTLSANDMVYMILVLGLMVSLNKKPDLHFVYPPCAYRSGYLPNHHVDTSLQTGVNQGHVLVYEYSDPESFAVVARNVRFKPVLVPARDLPIFGEKPFEVED